MTRLPEIQIAHQARPQPQALDIERAVLGAIMIESRVFEIVHALLKTPDVFYRINHQRIYNACIALNQSNTPIDLLTVANQLKINGYLGEGKEMQLWELSEIASAVASSANVEFHAHILLQKHIKRETLQFCGFHLAKAYDETVDCFETLAEMETFLGRMETLATTNKSQTIAEMAPDFLADLDKRVAADRGGSPLPVGLPFPFAKFREYIPCGLEKKKLMVLGADPKSGKTAFAMNFLAMYGGAFFSLELPREEVNRRFVAMTTGINYNALKTGKLNDQQILDVHDAVSNKLNHIHLIDDKGLTIEQIKFRCAEIKRRSPLPLIVIDYLQLIKPSNDKDDSVKALDHIVKSCNEIADQMDAPVILICAWKAQVGDADPTMARFRGTTLIQYAANIVVGLTALDQNTFVDNGIKVRAIQPWLMAAREAEPFGKEQVPPLWFYGSRFIFSDPVTYGFQPQTAPF